MTFSLRPYQGGSIDAVFDFWKQGGGSPLIDLATGLGKSVVIAELNKRLLSWSPDMRVMMLVDSRELVRQNFMQLLRVWPEAPVGLYSAGLNKRDVGKRITFASIQSVYKKPEIFGVRQIVMVDEAHMIPKSGVGMYAEFIEGLKRAYPQLRVIGLSATPYRMDSGHLCEGEDALFDKVVYEYGIGPATEDGWLCPLTARMGSVEIDVGGVAKRGGDFVQKALEQAANKAEVVERACDDMIARGANRRSWLIFCSGVAHAGDVAECLRSKGVPAASVDGSMNKTDRDRIIEDFKSGKLRAVTNANVLTKGFDAPGVDMLALLRPTLSVPLYVQIMGRGTRVLGVDLNAFDNAEDRKAAIAASDKPNCLVLDYAGNVRRHGPVDAIVIEEKKKGEPVEDDPLKVAADDVSAKECPECETLVAINARSCPDCGFEFGEPKHEDKADTDVAVMAKDLQDMWIPVRSWNAYLHHKGGDLNARPTVRVDYVVGAQTVSEWLPFEHPGAWKVAAFWWREHWGQRHYPRDCEEALDRWHELRPPVEVTLKRQGKFMKIDKRRLPVGGGHGVKEVQL